MTVKSFSLDFEAGNPASKKYIETRIVLKQDDQWRGYTYRWNDEQTDALLVGAKGMDSTYEIKDAQAPAVCESKCGTIRAATNACSVTRAQLDLC